MLHGVKIKTLAGNLRRICILNQKLFKTACITLCLGNNLGIIRIRLL